VRHANVLFTPNDCGVARLLRGVEARNYLGRARLRGQNTGSKKNGRGGRFTVSPKLVLPKFTSEVETGRAMSSLTTEEQVLYTPL